MGGMPADSMRSSNTVRAGDGGRWFSCFERPLTVGLTTVEEAELLRERMVSLSPHSIESTASALALFFHFLERDGKRGPRREVRLDSAESSDLRFLNDGVA